MKKIVALLIVILLVYFGYKFYLSKKEPEPEYVLDENYIFSFNHSDEMVTNIVNSTYYVYDDTKAVLKEEFINKTTNEIDDTTYTDVTITDRTFSTNNVLNGLLSTNIIGDSGLSNFYRYTFYVKPTNKTYTLKRTDEVTLMAIKALENK